MGTGTHESLIDVSLLNHTIEKHQGCKVACLEEMAYNKGWLTKQRAAAAELMIKTEYGQYLLSIMGERNP